MVAFVLAVRDPIPSLATMRGLPWYLWTGGALGGFFIVMAMAAIGFNTDIVKLVKTGGKPIFMGFCCWVAIAGVSLLVQHLLGIW